MLISKQAGTHQQMSNLGAAEALRNARFEDIASVLDAQELQVMLR